MTTKESRSSRMRLGTAAFLAMIAVAPAVAEPQAPVAPDAADALSLAELGNIEVYAASKRRQSIEDAPASVTIITAAEIDDSTPSRPAGAALPRPRFRPSK